MKIRMIPVLYACADSRRSLCATVYPAHIQVLAFIRTGRRTMRPRGQGSGGCSPPGFPIQGHPVMRGHLRAACNQVCRVEIVDIILSCDPREVCDFLVHHAEEIGQACDTTGDITLGRKGGVVRGNSCWAETRMTDPVLLTVDSDQGCGPEVYGIGSKRQTFCHIGRRPDAPACNQGNPVFSPETGALPDSPGQGTHKGNTRHCPGRSRLWPRFLPRTHLWQ